MIVLTLMIDHTLPIICSPDGKTPRGLGTTVGPSILHLTYAAKSNGQGQTSDIDRDNDHIRKLFVCYILLLNWCH